MFKQNISFLAEVAEEKYPLQWYIGMTILLVVIMIPWIYILFKYGFFRKLRIRYFLPDGQEFCEVYLKRKEAIKLVNAPIIEGKEFIGWYMDKDYEKEFNLTNMPDENLKIYAKYNDLGEDMDGE